MGPTVCMNVSCGSRTAIEWKKGWVLPSGGFAILCDKCGSAYDQLIFCDTFHFNESGWRQCIPCGKRLHCGCIASKSLFELLDVGGVECISCVRKSEISSIPSDACQEGVLESSPKAHNVSPTSSNDDKASRPGTSGNLIEQESSSADSKMDENTIVEGCSSVKREQDVLPLRDVGATTFLNPTQPSAGPSPSIGTNRDNATKEFESIGSACLNISLGTSHLNFGLPIPSLAVEGREMNKVESSFHQGQRSGHLLLKPPKLGPNMSPETSKDGISHIRFLRPPGEGKGRNQLLPRYWPRITDQELQQISGGSNSTILPLFEKVLSASDAGRIGRLVLPKACAEAYFPPISQPEGLPLKVQDAKGKDWVFQFRFWPNNNSRMYVLEGVTPCIHSMQLQAGDTVTFSRIEPEGKLLMGFRKASYSLAVQDTQVPVSACPSGALPKESFFPGGLENLPNIHGYSGVLQSLKGNVDPQLSLLSGHLKSLDGDIRWLKPEKSGGRLNDGFPFQLSVPVLERTRKIGSKSKRLHIDSEDAMELKLTWEEVQDLLRPPSSVKPSIVVVEDHAFEEYEEPPVYGKATIFTVRLSGEQDQWAQCDSCYKWRRLPVDVLLPARWTCADNMWDPKRCSCSVVDETGTKELENLLRMNMDFRKRKITGSQNPVPHIEPQPGSSRVVPIDDGNSAVGGPTTKHPRHRPGCMCIVCIQPPSGKGPKHKPTCTCNVCMTVKRRFKTLMMRRKKRQLEREAETTNKKQMWSKNETEIVGSSRRDEPDSDPSKFLVERVEMGKGGIDLNCHPDREKVPPLMPGRVSMTNLLQEASLPLEAYMRQNGLTTLICEQQVSSSSPVLPQRTGENEGQATDGSNFTSSLREREGVGD